MRDHDAKAGAADAADGANAGTARPRALRLPSHCRMRFKREFDRVYKEGVRARGTTILVVAAPSSHPHGARYGLSVGRKLSKSAVVRNRVRRVLREAFRLRRAELPPLDLVLIPQDARRRWNTPEAGDELIALALKAARKLAERSARG
jgi:ribonuclease P protein component